MSSTWLNMLIRNVHRVRFRSCDNIAMMHDNLFIVRYLICKTYITRMIYSKFHEQTHTMSTVTSPTLVDPCCLRKALTRSCSFGILSARTFFRSVEASLNDLKNMVEVIFCKKEKKKLILDYILNFFLSRFNSYYL